MLKRTGDAAACVVRVPTGTSRTTIVTSDACALAGTAEAATRRRRAIRFMSGRGVRTVPKPGFADKGTDPLPNTILTPVKRAVLLVFLAAAVVAGGALGASGEKPRVLAV